MGILKWMYGINRLNKIGNEYTRGSLGITGVAVEMREKKLVWFGNVKNN